MSARARPRAGPRSLIDRMLAPLHTFTSMASAGGLVLLATTVVALVWANGPWAASYHHLWETPVRVGLGGWTAEWSLHHLINDGLMAVFFFLVGLEIKREVLAGELSSARAAALPMVAAVGGMVVPALLYTAFNAGTAGVRGWGVPMATDIAFALGVLALLGDRVPVGLKVFLAALAIVDDIGAVLVIALFYSAGVSWGALGLAAALLLLAVGANAAGVRRPWAYAAIGVALWAAVLASGIHATVAGVLLALAIPVRTRIDEEEFQGEARRALGEFEAAARRTANEPHVTVLSNAEHHSAIEELETLCEQVQPPLIRLEHALHGVVAFAIMPVFALANAGVVLSAESIGLARGSMVTWGVIVGLVLGKPLGIVGFSWLATRMGIATLPARVTWPAIVGAGLLGGIGFTMALFIAGLAFVQPADLELAKMGVLMASALTGIAGWLWLRRVLPSETAPEPRYEPEPEPGHELEPDAA